MGFLGRFGKRILLMGVVSMLIIATVTVITSVFNIQPYLDQSGLNYSALMVFCFIWGMAGALVSLALSRIMAKWMMGVKLVDPNTMDPTLRHLVQRVYEYSQKAGLTTMPEVGIYEGEEMNAFATGPTRNRSLVAVSTGLLQRMDAPQVEGVLAHEVAHIANGDMVTMTLVQGVVNAFVMFLARIAGFFVAQLVEEGKRHWVRFAVTMVAEILLGILGMMVVAAVSRRREFRADAGGASLAGTDKMIAGLEALKVNLQRHLGENEPEQPALASLKISGRPSRFFQLLSTHPDLDDRINALKATQLKNWM